MFARVRPMAGRVENTSLDRRASCKVRRMLQVCHNAASRRSAKRRASQGVTIPIESGSGYSVYRAAVERDEISWQDAKAVELWR